MGEYGMNKTMYQTTAWYISESSSGSFIHVTYYKTDKRFGFDNKSATTNFTYHSQSFSWRRSWFIKKYWRQHYSFLIDRYLYENENSMNHDLIMFTDSVIQNLIDLPVILIIQSHIVLQQVIVRWCTRREKSYLQCNSCQTIRGTDRIIIFKYI